MILVKREVNIPLNFPVFNRREVKSGAFIYGISGVDKFEKLSLTRKLFISGHGLIDNVASIS